jgi:hypothetical protein
MEPKMFTPTVVVGLGEAGCRMAAAVDDRATEENVAEAVEILGIDSRTEGLNSILPDDASSLALESRETRWSLDRTELPYLENDHELSPVGGARRQRPVGRWFVDNPEGLERASRFLEARIESFVNGLKQSLSDLSGTELNVWAVNSLAGGTGSGAFPLVFGLLDELLADLEGEQGIDTRLRGAGSLLRVSQLEDSPVKPDYVPAFYSNAYAALSDVRALLGDEQASLSPHPGAGLFKQDELDIGGAVDQYFLAGILEQERGHLESVNEMIADAIYYLDAFNGTFANRANFPTHAPARSTHLFSLAGAEVTAPTETAERYLELGDDIANTRAELDRLEYERKSVAKDVHYLDTVLSLDRASRPASDSPVSTSLVRQCDEKAAAVGRHVSPAELDSRLDDAVADLVTNVDLDDDRAFDPSAVVRYLVTNRLTNVVEQRHARARDQLSEFVATLVDRYRIQLTELVDEQVIGHLESNPAEGADEVTQALEAKRELLIEERKESLPVVGDLFGDLDLRIDELSEAIDDLSALRTKFDTAQTLRDEVYADFDESRDALRDRRMECEERRHELDDQSAVREHDVETRRAHRDEIAEDLRSGRRGHYRSTLPIEEIEHLDWATLERAREEGFTALVEAGLVSRETIEGVLETVCDDLREPIQDLNDFDVDPPVGILGPVLADENADEWLGHIEEFATRSGFGAVEPRADTADPLSVGLVGLYAGIELEQTSEFGTLDEYFTDPDRDLSALFGSEVDSVPNPVAYPELH